MQNKWQYDWKNGFLISLTFVELEFQLHDSYETYTDSLKQFSWLYPESQKISCDLLSYYGKELAINFEYVWFLEMATF